MSKFERFQSVLVTIDIHGFKIKNTIGMVDRIDDNKYAIYFNSLKRSFWIEEVNLSLISESKVLNKDIIKYINEQFEDVKLFLQNFKGQYTISRGQIKLKRSKQKADEVPPDALPF